MSADFKFGRLLRFMFVALGVLALFVAFWRTSPTGALIFLGGVLILAGARIAT